MVSENLKTLVDEPVTVDRAAFLEEAVQAARAAGHIWPTFAACEAALDSEFGTTELALQANNVFNLRAPFRFSSAMAGQIYTQRVNGRQCDWLRFGTLEDCFTARMGKLRSFTMYYLAIRAKTGLEYAREISKLWSSDPERVKKILALVALLPTFFGEEGKP